LLLLALQTTTSSVDDRVDAVTLVLVLLFIGSMAGLSVLLSRRSGDEPPAAATPEPESSATAMEAPPTPPRRERPPAPPARTTPRWLEGVSFPGPIAGLSEATQVIEALVAARRDRDLARGLRLYTPASLASLRDSLGVDAAGLAERLDRAEFHGEPPALRSVELLDITGDRMTVQAGYANGTSERYRLVRSGGEWLIDAIE